MFIDSGHPDFELGLNVACIGMIDEIAMRQKLTPSAWTEMPKRKADQNIEEWLKEVPVAVESSRTVVEPNDNQGARATVLTAESSSLPLVEILRPDQQKSVGRGCYLGRVDLDTL